MGVLIMLASCSPKLDIYKDSKPIADVKKYFDGNIKAWGIVQKRNGEVSTKFDIDMVGTWEGNKGTLVEDFTYYNGKTQQRIWTITKHDDSTYTGTANDIIGEATGKINGAAISWEYTMDIEVEGKTYRVKLDDWMWQMNDGILINRSYIKKFGFTVAELTLFMQKQNK